MAADMETLQAQAAEITDPQSKEAELLMLNIQMELLKTQQKMVKKLASIEFYLGVIGLIMLVSFILAVTHL